jgi:hypothetical protein
MTKNDLIAKGVESEHIHEITVSLDDLIESGCDDERDFFYEYCYSDKLDFDYQIHRWITGTNGNFINILVWAERWKY